jgi:hypothetical protein
MFKGFIMKKTVLASTIAIAFGMGGAALAQPHHHHQRSGVELNQHADDAAVANDDSMAANDSMNDNSRNQNNSDGDAKAYDTGAVAANNGATASAVLRNAFNTNDSFNSTRYIAKSKLEGSVTNNHIHGVGNMVSNQGSADGGTGKGGTGGVATGGLARSNGGNSAGATGGEAGANEIDDLATGDDFRGRRPISGDNRVRQTAGNGGAATTDRGGDATSTAGNASATGGSGGSGGSAGTIRLTAGTFDMSNTMTRVGQSAAGIMLASQNTGLSALVQQSVTVQANMGQ